MKRTISFFLILVFILLLCGCSASSNSDESKLQERISQLEQENQELKQQISELQNGDNTIKDNTKQDNEPIGDSAPKTVSLNTTFDVADVMSITLLSSEWCDEIKPSNTNGVYSYFKDVDGEKFFVVHGELKNLASKTLDITYAGKAEILINEKYTLSATMELEEPEGNSFYGDAKPLQTLPLIIYCSVSDELYESYNTIKLTLDLVSDDDKVEFFYNDDYPHESFVISFDK